MINGQLSVTVIGINNSQLIPLVLNIQYNNENLVTTFLLVQNHLTLYNIAAKGIDKHQNHDENS